MASYTDRERRTDASKNAQAAQAQFQQTIAEKDQQIVGLVEKVDCLVGEVQNLSNMVETLMFEQKLANEKYLILKSRYNTLAIGQQKEDLVNSNPYWKRPTEGANAVRYNQNTKKQMYQLLRNAENTSPTSPRRVISSIGVLYKDNVISQSLLRDQIAELENQLAASQLENVHLQNIIAQQGINTSSMEDLQQQQQQQQEQQQSGSQAILPEEKQPVFQQYHSINTMVQRYQESS